MKRLILAVALLLPTAALAGVDFDLKSNTLTISGPTTGWQAIQVAGYVASGKVQRVIMWGDGGDYYAGLTIGRILSEVHPLVIIPGGKRCISACAFAALGGKFVVVNGTMLFHRPYLTQVSTRLGLEAVAGVFGKAYIDAVDYVVRMGYPIDFARNVINDTSPCRFMVVTRTEQLRSMRGGVLDKVRKAYTIEDHCPKP